jgi:hypothetical protein
MINWLQDYIAPRPEHIDEPEPISGVDIFLAGVVAVVALFCVAVLVVMAWAMMGGG